MIKFNGAAAEQPPVTQPKHDTQRHPDYGDYSPEQDAELVAVLRDAMGRFRTEGVVNHDVLRPVMDRWDVATIMRKMCGDPAVLPEGITRTDDMVGAFVKEFLTIYATPRRIALQNLRDIVAAEAVNDWEKGSLDGLVVMRAAIEKDMPQAMNPAEIRSIFTETQHPFWDVARTNAMAEDLVQNDPEAVTYLQYQYERYADFPISRDEVRRPGFVSGLPPSYAWDLVNASLGRDDDISSPDAMYASRKGEVIRSLVLDDATLRNRLRDAIGTDDAVYGHMLQRAEFARRRSVGIGRRTDQINVIETIHQSAMSAENDQERQFGFTVNSAIAPLGRDTVAYFSPIGAFLGVARKADVAVSREQRRVFNDTFSMAHSMSGVRPFQEHWAYDYVADPYVATLANVLIFADRLPQRIVDPIRDAFDAYNMDFDMFAQKMRRGSFESVAGSVEHLTKMCDVVSSAISPIWPTLALRRNALLTSRHRSCSV